MQYQSTQPSEAAEIERLFNSVFTNSEGEEEGRLIGNLVKELIATTDSNDLYGFVAVDQDQIVGAIFFSRLTFKDGINAFILAPVAVHSGHQGKGIGQALINYGLQEMKTKGINFVTTYGDSAFYSKVGFQPLSEDTIQAPHQLSHPEGWLGQSLTNEPIKPVPGQSACVKAFDNPAYW